MPSTTLVELLKSAGVPSFYAGVWFRGCDLVNGTLYVPDRQSGESIGKLFGGKLRAAFPALHIRVGAPLKAADKPSPPSILNAAGRKAWRGEQHTAKQQTLQESE